MGLQVADSMVVDKLGVLVEVAVIVAVSSISLATLEVAASVEATLVVFVFTAAAIFALVFVVKNIVVVEIAVGVVVPPTSHVV